MNTAGIIALAALCALHIMVSLALVFAGKASNAEKLAILPFVLALPVFGAAFVYISRQKPGERRETPVTEMYRRISDDLSPLAAAAGKDMLSVAPFEEILLIDGEAARREAMMYILRRDPADYLDMLKAARVSADTEIVHYATATIMEVQREYELSLQRWQAEFKLRPGDIEIIDNYIKVLSAYEGTGLLQGFTLDNLRRRLSEALERKLAVQPDSHSAHLSLAENEILLRRYKNALRVAEQMRAKWPSDEASWIAGLRACMCAGDSTEKAKITAKLLNADVNWSRAGREEIEFLCGSHVPAKAGPYESKEVRLAAK